ncbi:MAG: WbqC family protein [Candidatus Obscuribacter sp.]|nr:WbqC family protein [Candidatus Obscuribacter sp.]
MTLQLQCTKRKTLDRFYLTAAYIPWLGYFDRIFKSDLHVILDHVQFEKRSLLHAINSLQILLHFGSRYLSKPKGSIKSNDR